MPISLEDILGTEPVTGRAILIRAKDPGAVVRSKGAVASFLQQQAPSTLEGKFYDEMAKKMKEGLKAQGVDADVQVVEPSGWQSAGSSPVWKPLAIGASALGVGLLGWMLFGGRGHKAPR